jgi:hypothetical protein
VVESEDAANKLLDDFFERTATRRFRVLDAAVQGNQVFAGWEGELVFRAGITIAGMTLPTELTVHLRGAERFQLNSDGKIEELDIYHETTSVVQATRQLIEAQKEN